MNKIYTQDKLCTLNENTFKYTVKKYDAELIMYNIDYIHNSSEALILGFVDLDDKLDDPNRLDNTNIFQLDKSENKAYYLITKERQKRTKLLGFVKVDENKYVGIVSKKAAMPLILVIILAALLISSIIVLNYADNRSNTDHNVSNKHNKPQKELAETIQSDGTVTNNDLFVPDTGSIEFAGYDLVWAAADSRIILLENPESNDVYFTYKITNNADDSIILDETGLITPGTALEWDAYDTLPSGEYNITMYISTYDMEDTSINYTPAVMDNVTLKIY